MINKDLVFNFSPSEFAFNYEGCKKCYYDKKVNNIVLKTPFPGAFSKFDREQKKYYNNKSSKIISSSLDDGVIVSDYNKKLSSKVLHDNKDRPFTLGGFIDAYIKHKDSYTVIDFKTTTISDNQPTIYKSQLQSYAVIMENPKEGSLKLNPITNLGILCFEPSNIINVNKKDCEVKMTTKWFDVKRDDKELIAYITKIQDLLYDDKIPKSDENCNICKFKKVINNEK
jgi:hypothetical protein